MVDKFNLAVFTEFDGVSIIEQRITAIRIYGRQRSQAFCIGRVECNSLRVGLCFKLLLNGESSASGRSERVSIADDADWSSWSADSAASSEAAVTESAVKRMDRHKTVQSMRNRRFFNMRFPPAFLSGFHQSLLTAAFLDLRLYTVVVNCHRRKLIITYSEKYVNKTLYDTYKIYKSKPAWHVRNYTPRELAHKRKIFEFTDFC